MSDVDTKWPYSHVAL